MPYASAQSGNGRKAEESKMRVAVVGSRGLSVDMGAYLPKDITEIISGGARGIDRAAEAYADAHGLAKRIFLPDYQKFGRRAPLLRNEQIVQAADLIIAIWDGASRGTKYTIDYAKKAGKPVRVFLVEKRKMA